LHNENQWLIPHPGELRIEKFILEFLVVIISTKSLPVNPLYGNAEAGAKFNKKL
jgi:hypothetical protein